MALKVEGGFILDYDVMIIGAGPAGIFTALELNKLRPDLKVMILDSGPAIDSRHCPARTTGQCAHCNPCRIMNGWAGAGAFSDGKLSLSYEVGGNITDYLSEDKAQNLIHYADENYYLKFGAPTEVYGLNDKFTEKIAYQAKKENIQLIPCPVRHMGTEYSFEVLRNMYCFLKKQPNFTFLEYTTAQSIIVENGCVTGVRVTDRKGEQKSYTARYIVAAPGGGGANWLAGIAKENKL